MSTPAPRLKLIIGPGAIAGAGRESRIDDTQLLAAVRAGDAKAANALYLRARPVVERTIRKLLGRSDQERQDIFQQVMVEIVRSVDAYRGDCPFDAWMSILAARIVYKALRHRRVERRVFEDSWPPPDVAGPDHPARRTMLRSTIDRVRRHLDDVDRDRVWAFLLHDVHGYELREMATIMGTSVAAAQSRLVRGRKDLHKRIAGDPELAGELVRTEGGR